MTENSKSNWTIVLTLVKYVVTLALGFVSGTNVSSMIN